MSLYDSITRIARHEASARSVASIARVVEIFTEGDHAVTLELRDTGLKLPRVPVAVGALGFASIPEVDDLVVVLFVEGDVNQPVIVGRLYHADLDPPTYASGEMVLQLPPGAEPKVDFKIVGDEPSVNLKLPDEVELNIVRDKVLVKVGEVMLSITSSGGGRVEINAGGSKMTLKKDGDVEIAAQGKLTLKGSEVEVSGSAKVKVSGGQVEIN